MSFAVHHGVKIFWDERGQGAPLLLIQGLGFSSDAWFRSIPRFAARYRTIYFDNRGVGRSEVPPGPYALMDMAADAAAVLDAAGVSSAHLFGMSMGGMIAQQFALQYPRRVRSLILGCTTAGGLFTPEAAQALYWNGTPSAEEAARVAYAFVYSLATDRALLEQDLAVRRPWFPTPAGYNAQLDGILGWDVRDRLREIQAPTLVIHGEEDLIIPPAQGRQIAAAIPGAQIALLRRAGHIFTTDGEEESHRIMLAFLARVEQRQAPAQR